MKWNEKGKNERPSSACWRIPVLGVQIYLERWKIVPTKLIICILSSRSHWVLKFKLVFRLSIKIQIFTGFPVQISNSRAWRDKYHPIYSQLLLR